MSSLDKIRKERRDLAALIIAFGFVIGCVLYDLATSLIYKGINHPVAVALGHDVAPNGRIHFHGTSPLGFSLLSGGLVIRSIALIAGAIFLIQIGRRALREEFFSLKVLCLFRRSCIAVAATFLGYGLQLLGADVISHQYHLNQEWSHQFIFPNYMFTVSYFFLITLIIMTIIVKRGIQMQEDQEGLI